MLIDTGDSDYARGKIVAGMARAFPDYVFLIETKNKDDSFYLKHAEFHLKTGELTGTEVSGFAGMHPGKRRTINLDDVDVILL